MKALIYVDGWKIIRNLHPNTLAKELQDLADQYGKPVLAELQGCGSTALSYIIPNGYASESLCTVIGRNSQQCVADTPKKAKDLYMSLYSPDKYHHCTKTGAYIFKYTFDLYNAGDESGTVTAWKIEHPQEKVEKDATKEEEVPAE